MRNQSEIVSAFIKLAKQTTRVYEAAKKAVNTEDKLTSDLLHEIELEGTSCSKRSKTATRLRENRLDRRYYKDIVEELEPLYEFLLKPEHIKTINALEQVLGKMRKEESYHADRTYYPRVNRMEQEKMGGGEK